MADEPTPTERIAAELVFSDALTPNHDGTPEWYTVDADNVEHLVRTVLELAKPHLLEIEPEHGGRMLPHSSASDCRRCGVEWAVKRVLDPLPPRRINTQEENIAFRKDWDDRVKRGMNG